VLRYGTPAALVATSAALALLAHAALVSASGQLPLETDVPESPSAGALELDAAYGLDRVRRARDEGHGTRTDMAAPRLLLDYGITDRVEARIDGTGALTHHPGGATAFGLEEISAGIKYRFLDQPEESDEEAGKANDTASEERQDRWAGEGPVSVSVFPQFSFPTGSRREGIRDAEYSVSVPLDVSRQQGDLTFVGEGAFQWVYHQRAGPNEFELGLAAFYDLTPRWTLLGEGRVNLPTVGQGTAEWLFNLGVLYELTDQLAVFGSAGRTFRASPRIEERTLMFIVGVEITYPAPPTESRPAP